MRVAHLQKAYPVFRNFITYATSEDFKVEQYVDNEFYVDQVLLAHDGSMSADVKAIRHYPSESPQAFYMINLPKKKVIGKR